jgi:trk system potassium uptake protein TrkA
MKALVIGCGRLGAELAYRLYQRGHEVSIVDIDEKAFAKLPSDFEGRFSEGSALNRDVLRRAGIEGCDSVAVVTDSDSLNAVVGHLAKTTFNIPNVVVRNYDPRYRSTQEAFDLQVISSLSWGAQRIEEMMVHGDVRAVFSAGNGEVEVYEIAIPEKCAGLTVGELLAAELCMPVAVTRAGKAILPSLKFQLLTGDVLHVSATMDGIEGLRERVCPPRG